MRTIQLLILLLATPRFYCSNDHLFNLIQADLNDILKNTKIYLNGHLTSLNKIYGDVQPTADNFDPGEEIWKIMGSAAIEDIQPIGHSPEQSLAIACDNIDYVERKFIFDPSIEIPASLIPISSPDTASDIARAIVDYIQVPKTNALPVISILGERLIGKSVTLYKIQVEIAKSIPEAWTLVVNLPLAVESFDNINLKCLFSLHLSAKYFEFFENVLKVNPKRIVILMDGVDNISDARMPQINVIINELVQKGASVVLSGRVHVINHLSNLNIMHYVIREMTFHEMKQFLTNTWLSMIRNEENHPSSSEKFKYISKNEIATRLETYVTAFTQTLYNTPVPKIPPMLKILANKFKYMKSKLSSRLNTEVYNVGCLNYVLNTWNAAEKLHTVLEQVLFNKHKLYTELIRNVGRNMNDQMRSAYGRLALQQILHENDITPVLKLQRKFRVGINHLIVIQPSILDLVHSHPGNQFRLAFTHSEFKYYFASEEVWEMLMRNDRTHTEVLIDIFSNPRMCRVVEFINGKLENIDRNTQEFITRKLIIRSGVLQYKILDNALIHGFQDFFLMCYNTIVTKILSLKEIYEWYFQRIIVVKNVDKLILGMLSWKKSPEVNYDLPVLLVARGLSKILLSEPAWQSVIGKPHNYQRILRAMIEIDIPITEDIKMMIDRINTYTLNLNQLLYHAIFTHGEDGVNIANYLISIGANPQVSYGPNGGVLLHAAVQWRSKKLLQYVIEELNVRPVDLPDYLGNTVLSLALDANPSILHSPVTWWEMMYYLVETMIHLEPPSIKNIFTVNEVDNPRWEKLLTINLDSLLQQHDGTYEESLVLSDSRPPITWNLSPEALTLRRNAVLAKLHQINPDISLVEILIHYRDMSPATPEIQEYYRNTIQVYIQRNREQNKMDVVSRIINTLIANIAGTGDFQDLDFFFGLEMLQNMPINTYEEFLYNLDQRYLKLAAVLPSSTSFDPQFEFLKQANYLRDRIRHHIRLASPMVESKLHDNNNDVTQCLSRRTRRAHSSNMICYISWDDVNRFNDASQHSRSNEISINSDKFIRTLENEQFLDGNKIKQLISLVKQLSIGKSVTGNSRMLVADIIRYKSLRFYRQNQRLNNVIDHLSDELPKRKLFPVSSRSIALHAAAAIPLVTSIYGTISNCVHQTNGTNSNCLIASHVLAFSLATAPVAASAAKLVPWTVNWLSKTALDVLPPSTPIRIRQTVLGLRNFGLQQGAKMILAVPKILFFGLDLYNVIDMSIMIDACSRRGCLSNEQLDYVISLSFSTGNIGATLIDSLWLRTSVWRFNAIMIMIAIAEIITLGIKEVIYYKQNYGTDWEEDFRIFFHKIAFQSAPADVQALAQRRHWVDHMQNYTEEILKSDNGHIVAYGVGLGAFVNNAVVASAGSINMGEYSEQHATGLSRVIPSETRGTQLLCVPQRDPAANYDKYSSKSSNAFYRCKNTFVIADKLQWVSEPRSKSSYIVFNLEYINAGMIVGSELFNNLFLVYEGTNSLNLISGSGYITNTFVLEKETFYGTITLYNEARANVIDISTIRGEFIMDFQWSSLLQNGQIKFTNSKFFSIFTRGGGLSKLHLVGRKHIQDFMTCDYSKTDEIDSNFESSSITVDGRGGKSSTEMDTISDCKLSIVHPFTYISGTNSTNMMYIANVPLSLVTGQINTMTAGASTIDLQQSSFTVVFVNRPLFESISSVTYAPSNQTLTWHLKYSIFTSLFLSITPYGKSSPDASENITHENLKYKSPNCIFIDSFFNSTVVPVMPSPTDGIATVSVDRFNVFASVDSPRLKDALAHYRRMKMYISGELHVVTQLTHSPTGQSFTFGSTVDDQFYIDGNTTFLSGGDGCDVYALNSKSPKYVWIDNEASDYALDTLVIPDTLCDTLHAEMGAPLAGCCDNSEDYDITLFCSVKLGMKMSPAVHVVLRNYLLESPHRHLQIYWRDSMYIILPPRWIQGDAVFDTQSNNDKKLEMATLFSLNGDWKFTTLSMQSHDRYLVVNMTSERRNPLVAYRSGLNVILARKIFSRNSSSYILLEKFFEKKSLNVSQNWLPFKIFIIGNNTDEATTPKLVTVKDISNLLAMDARLVNTPSNKHNKDLIQEYFFNAKYSTKRNNKLSISPNDKPSIKGVYKLGILVIANAEPGEFNITWRNNTSLSLCLRETCIFLKDWCHSIHRLHRIEFIDRLDQRPITISSLPGINCEKTTSPRHVNRMLKKIRQKFVIAQKEFSVSDADDSDVARLNQCFAIIFVDTITKKSMFKLFGFSSILAQATFIRDNCKTLFARHELNKISLRDLKTTLEKMINRYRVSHGVNKKHEKSILLFRETIKVIDDNCWNAFSNSLYNSNYSDYNDQCQHLIKKVQNLLLVIE